MRSCLLDKNLSRWASWIFLVLVDFLEFESLSRLPVVSFYEDAFRKATGVALKVVPPGPPRQRVSMGDCENPFCSSVASTQAGCEACLELQVKAQRTIAQKRTPFQISCFAGLTEVAVPVFVGDHHVATLMSGQVFRRPPTERDFAMVVGMVDGTDPEWSRKARNAYFATPVVNAERFQAIIQLLSIFAQYLADFATRFAAVGKADEPPAVTSAKDYVKAHFEEPITLEQVVEHVHLSRFHFCKLFKKATGLTLTEYIACVRVEHAKTLLVDPTTRISDVVFASGFGSVPRFNSVFKRYVGMSPSEYRKGARPQVPAL
ncbi:melibiose operon regulatory protein [mine drainage metagenome]|uniref:Melibiose operon regulatory protein n=1 Tax=mine drainage metagenome TaxID=410659 RepID=A0A1J5TRK5_9ZZZZ